jgi:hypothetical protein
MLIKQTTCIYFLGMANFITIFHLCMIFGFCVSLMEVCSEFRIGLGALLSGARHISDEMLQAVAER